jgi:hypothetical protein
MGDTSSTIGEKMLGSLEFFYRQLSRATVAILYVTLAFFCVTLVFALLGLPDAVVSFRSATVVLASVFGGMLAIFLLTALVWALVRFLNRHTSPSGS